MAYLDGFVTPVPTANREPYRVHVSYPAMMYLTARSPHSQELGSRRTMRRSASRGSIGRRRKPAIPAW